jgi:hypothetical protein
VQVRSSSSSSSKIVLLVMAVLTRGRSILESLIGDSTLQEIFGGANKNEKNSPKVAQRQSPSSSTSRIRIKELSSLANDVVAQCARLVTSLPHSLLLLLLQGIGKKEKSVAW